MSEDYKAGQNSIAPTLFVGLGGTGSRIVDRIASRVMHLSNWESQLQDLIHFVSIDTNEGDQKRLKTIPQGNRLNIAGFDKQQAFANFLKSDDPQVKQWIDQSYQPRPGNKPGAGQIRIESRFGFFFFSPTIKQRLEEIVGTALRPNNTWRQSSPAKFNVYLYCTLAGGTGSGSFLSSAYLIDFIIKKHNWQPSIIGNLLLSSLLTKVVGPELHADIHANTYAALKELEHLTKLDYKQVKDEGRNKEEFVFLRDERTRNEKQMITSAPFFISFIFDRSVHHDVPNVDLAIADAAYLQIFTPIIEELKAEYDNYEKNIAELTRLPGDLKYVGQGYAKNYGAFGAVALIFPGKDFLEYSAKRFAAEAIRSQITFGIDPNAENSDDDKRRRLAKLAVDYNDPRFLRMSDEGREKEINRAFLASVQELAKQDEALELTDGFWYKIVEQTDGINEKAESLTAKVERFLTESRNLLLNKIAIKDRAFVFHREGVNQYLELFNKLIEDVRSARKLIDEEIKILTVEAQEGDLVTKLNLQPIQQRYLIIRLLDKCENEWLPKAQEQAEKAKNKSLENIKMQDRLGQELYDSLKQAAASKALFNKDKAFFEARDSAQDEFRQAVTATRKAFDAEIRLRQLRALLEYLKQRSRLYSLLATHMDSLVIRLEGEAEKYRVGENYVVPPFALRVEVLQTLDEPKQRLWNQAYQELFIKEGRYISVFDREALAQTILEQLKPAVTSGGGVREKSVAEIVQDLDKALVDLGKKRLKPEIDRVDIAHGLDLEAKIVLNKPYITQDEIQAYISKKFYALEQLAGVMARVSVTEATALDDGTVTNRSRLLVTKENYGFESKLKDALTTGNRQVKVINWHDPQQIVVHDVITPMPLYYIEPVVNELEDAYIQVAKNERRGYNLHIDYKWEKSLVNLNPRKSEIIAGWSLNVLIDGIVSKAITKENGRWKWHYTEKRIIDLGDNFSALLYRLSEIYANQPDLQKHLENRITEFLDNMDNKDARRQEFLKAVSNYVTEIGAREMEHALTPIDVLERPILRMLERVLNNDVILEKEKVAEKGAGGGFDFS